MSSFTNIIILTITAAVMENVVFARAVGIDHLLEKDRGYKGILIFGFWIGAVAIFAATFSWIAIRTFQVVFILNRFKAIMVLASVSIAYIGLTFLAIKKDLRKFHIEEQLVTLCCYNGAAFLMVLIAITTSKSFLEVLAYCIGGTIGLIIAMLLIHAGRERLEMCRVPASFSGIPIMMIYIGILGLAIYGLVGHQLPT